MGSFGQVRKPEGRLLDSGEYLFELGDLEPFQGEWGDSITWKFRVLSPRPPHDPIYWSDGTEADLWQITSADLVVGSRQHEWAQILSGRKLELSDAHTALCEGCEQCRPPADEEVIGRRMLAYVTHEVPKRGKRAGQRVAKIVAGSAKPAPKQASADGTAPAGSPRLRAELEAAWRRGVKRAIALDLDGAEDLLDVDPESLSDDALRTMLASLAKRVKDAQAEALV